MSEELEKDKRIGLLEAQRRDDVATNRGLVRRITELERALDDAEELILKQRDARRDLQDRADKLAEAASIVEEFYNDEVEPSDESMMALMEALTAYRSNLI